MMIKMNKDKQPKALHNIDGYFCMCKGAEKVYPQYVYPFSWEGYRFFAHRTPLPDCFGITYNATCAITGMSVVANCDTPKDAIKDALYRLTANGKEVYEKGLEKAKTLVENEKAKSEAK